MLFNSLTFAFFLPLVFALYWLIPGKKLNARNLLLLAASYFFYGLWDWRFLGLIIASSLGDFILGLAIHKAENHGRKKGFLALSIIFNLGILGFFKYWNFFAGSLVDLLGNFGIHSDVQLLNIILPVGISFYTFQSLSYTIDIYRKKIQPTHQALAFCTYVAFFPQLVAGPIERARHLLPQFASKRIFDSYKAIIGLRLIFLGLFKKVVIADNLAPFVNEIFGHSCDYQGVTVLFAVIFFGIQIYCDFAGYSEIAIGTANLFGFDLMQNFRTPYFSTSIKEFWSRWHISLSTWFRDYVYLPLGGNQKGRVRWILAVLITFLLSGLWHGAEYTFVIWGGIHGFAYLIGKIIPRQKKKTFFVSVLGGITTYMIVTFSWIFFRAGTLDDARNIIVVGLGTISGNLFSADAWTSAFQLMTYLNPAAFMILPSLLIFIFFEVVSERYDLAGLAGKIPSFRRWTIYYILFAWFFLFGAIDEALQFIYFQF